MVRGGIMIRIQSLILLLSLFWVGFSTSMFGDDITVDVINDQNGNGVNDAEPNIAASEATIYIFADLDSNGLRDDGEAPFDSATTLGGNTVFYVIDQWRQLYHS